MSALSVIGFPQPLGYRGSEAFLDLLGFLVQDPYLFVLSVKFLPHNLGASPQLPFEFQQFMGHG